MTFEAALAAAPDTARDRLDQVRGLVHAVARDLGITVEETVKWGQASFVPPRRMGTTLRMAAHEGGVALFVHCQTDLVGRWRSQFPEAFAYQDNRAVLLPTDDTLDEDALAVIIASTLTYHRDKRG
ncbi:MAG: DUF1801 domain-containing protein [Pseudomonadota bacterium]